MDQDAVSIVASTTDAPPHLMKLRQTETFGILDEHDRGVGHVDADLDHGCGHQYLEMMGSKCLHDPSRFRAVESSVDTPNSSGSQCSRDRFGLPGNGGHGSRLVGLDSRINDVGLASLLKFFSNEFPDQLSLRRRPDVGANSSAATGGFPENRMVEITIDGEAE